LWHPDFQKLINGWRDDGGEIADRNPWLSYSGFKALI